jgi:hypothetical protein
MWFSWLGAQMAGLRAARKGARLLRRLGFGAGFCAVRQEPPINWAKGLFGSIDDE